MHVCLYPGYSVSFSRTKDENFSSLSRKDTTKINRSQPILEKIATKLQKNQNRNKITKIRLNLKLITPLTCIDLYIENSALYLAILALNVHPVRFNNIDGMEGTIKDLGGGSKDTRRDRNAQW